MLNESSIVLPNIAHIISDLNGFGGTEATLLKYLLRSKIPAKNQMVIVLKEIGEENTIGAQMVQAGFNVIALHQRSGFITISGVLQLFALLRKFQPNIISAWLYHPCLLASLMAPFFQITPKVIWNIRSLPFAFFLKNPGRFVIQRILIILSYISNPIYVTNSTASANAHLAIGFRGNLNSWRVILNGVDIDQFSPNVDMRNNVRNELGITETTLILGCVGRFVSEKGYNVLFEALNILKERISNEQFSQIHLIAIGNGVDSNNLNFVKLSNKSEMNINTLHFLGKRSDISDLIKSFDIFILPSISESFPNSLVESMATGIACIATNVGQCSEVLPNKNLIVPANNAPLLAECLLKTIQMTPNERALLGRDNRKYVVENLSIEKMVMNFDAVFINSVSCE